MEENKNFSITGNETMEELALKVKEVDLMEHKIAVCVLIVSHIELDNGLRVGSLDYIPGIFKADQENPEEIEKSLLRREERSAKRGFRSIYPRGEAEFKKFLFFLKQNDENCFLELVKRYKKAVRKSDIKANILIILFIGGFFGSIFLVGYLMDNR
jgi:hypothetical protein